MNPIHPYLNAKRKNNHDSLWVKATQTNRSKKDGCRFNSYAKLLVTRRGHEISWSSDEMKPIALAIEDRFTALDAAPNPMGYGDMLNDIAEMIESDLFYETITDALLPAPPIK